MIPLRDDRWYEAKQWANFCSRILAGPKDGYWTDTSPKTVIQDKDACVKAAAEHDQKAKDKLIRYAIWRLKS